MTKDQLIELWLADLDEAAASEVQMLFDLWGRGGAVIEQTPDWEPSSHLLVKTYLRPEEVEELHQIEIGLAITNKIRQAQGLPPLPQLQRRILTDTDWAESWKAGYHVLRLGQHLIIKPSWHEYDPQPDDLIIELDPGMAFGSGLHPTTQLCLVALEEVSRPGMRVLDVGTGSGILAIAAAKLGARYVHALDTDPMAVRVTAQNIADNGEQDVVSVALGTLTNQPITGADGIPGEWDVIVANILANPLMDMAPAFFVNLAPGGILILSGINRGQMESVIASMESNCITAAGSSLQGDWAALFFEK